MEAFLNKWSEAAYTSVGFFWMALWAFILGYLISSMIQVFVTEKRMQETMGKAGKKDVLLGTFFGFISSSCSFSALATTKSLFQKGASFVASIAFLLASTNLVIELGIIISIFLGWQFLVGEYVGGILLILISWLLITIIKPSKLIKQARSKLKGDEDGHEHGHDPSDKKSMWSVERWRSVGMQFNMEWMMVWKDVTIGFTIAGLISAFIPDTFFQTLFTGSGQGNDSYSFLTLTQHAVVGPIAAFITFIGSMGNIPLAALLFSKGVSFAGVMAFIFSDLVVFPVLRINAKYYGWKMSLFIAFLLFSSLVVTSLVLHYGFDIAGMLPSPGSVTITDTEYFKLNYTFYLNCAFLIITGVLIYLSKKESSAHHHHHKMAPKSATMETVLKWLAYVSMLWLAGGLVVKYFVIG